MVRNNSQLNNSQSQALAENNSKFNIQHCQRQPFNIQNSTLRLRRKTLGNPVYVDPDHNAPR